MHKAEFYEVSPSPIWLTSQMGHPLAVLCLIIISLPGSLELSSVSYLLCVCVGWSVWNPCFHRVAGRGAQLQNWLAFTPHLFFLTQILNFQDDLGPMNVFFQQECSVLFVLIYLRFILPDTSFLLNASFKFLPKSYPGLHDLPPKV